MIDVGYDLLTVGADNNVVETTHVDRAVSRYWYR